MSTENKVTRSMLSSAEVFPDIMTVDMHQLLSGISTIFCGVTEMLKVLDVEHANQLVSEALRPREASPVEKTKSPTSDKPDEPKAAKATTANNSPSSQTPTKPSEPSSAEPTNDKAATPGITVDDITKIIVQKIRNDRSNSDKIRSILYGYGSAKVSELPPEKYEAFLTDISQL